MYTVLQIVVICEGKEPFPNPSAPPRNLDPFLLPSQPIALAFLPRETTGPLLR